MSLYTDLKAANIPLDHHESDLYALACQEAKDIAKANGEQGIAFISNVDGKLWLEFPFRFDPFWDGKVKAFR